MKLFRSFRREADLAFYGRHMHAKAIMLKKTFLTAISAGQQLCNAIPAYTQEAFTLLNKLLQKGSQARLLVMRPFHLLPSPP